MTTVTQPAHPHIRRSAAAPITNSLAMVLDASVEDTRRALQHLQLSAPAIRALSALGLDDRITPYPGGLTWRPDDHAGQIDISVDIGVGPAHVDGSVLAITTRFSPADDRAGARLLDAWPVIGPLAQHLTKRAARTVKEHVEQDEPGPASAT